MTAFVMLTLLVADPVLTLRATDDKPPDAAEAIVKSLDAKGLRLATGDENGDDLLAAFDDPGGGDGGANSQRF